LAVVVEVIIPGISRDQYDALRDAVDWFGTVPDGGLSHIVWWDGDDCHGVDTWESESAFAAFGETRLGPAMAQLGIEAQVIPTFHDPHEIFVPEAVKITLA